jgi:phage tail sheath protein FI
MPQYLAPGVYVEEIPGPRTIQGVSTSTAAFVGPCRFGPTSGRPELLTSYLDFTRIYGDAVDLTFEDAGEVPNYLALGVKGFFDEGGSSLYVVRTFAYTSLGTPEADHAVAAVPRATSLPGPTLTVRARFPGQAGNLRVAFTLRAGNNVLVETAAGPALTRVREFDTVWAVSGSLPDGDVYVVRRDPLTEDWRLTGSAPLALADAAAVHPLTVLVEVQRPTVDAQGLPAFGPPQSLGEFGFDPRAVGTGISTVLAANPPTRRQALTVPIALEDTDALTSLPAAPDELPGAIAIALFGRTILETASVPTTRLEDRQVVITLDGGSDGNAPDVTEYEGDPVNFSDYQNLATALPLNGLLALEAVDDISIAAVPGASTGWAGAGGDPTTAAQTGQAINNALITHCEKLLYRVAALDTPAQFLPDDALDYRNKRSSTHAALYYPWITVSHPIDGRRVEVPPAGYMAGVWARSDNFRGVIKAPANEVVRSALDLEVRLNKAQQELLNPEGVNCLRFFPGPGFLVWGARTISDDPEWKYLSIRRYFNYLEKSIDQGTQWVVFEINGPALWDAVRHTVEGFLLNEWKNGALLGSKPEEGFFVRCDASTMTADDLDNGRLICVIGVAAAKPAEFVIFRISQFTATTTT